MLAMKGTNIMFPVRLALTLWTAFAFLELGMTFELQDTIHALIEENIHLHDQLENLTRALHELKQLLWNHAKEGGHDPDIQHLWDEWKEHGISAETHHLLNHAFCGQDLHGAASRHQAQTFLLLPTFFCLSLLLF